MLDYKICIDNNLEKTLDKLRNKWKKEVKILEVVITQYKSEVYDI